MCSRRQHKPLQEWCAPTPPLLQADIINRVTAEVGQLKNIMVENIEKVRPFGTVLASRSCHDALQSSTAHAGGCVPAWSSSPNHNLARHSTLTSSMPLTRPTPTPPPTLPPNLQILDRGERLELLVQKTDHLSSDAFAFKRQARTLRNTLWWRHARMAGGIGAGVALLAYLLVAIICSPTFHC